MMAKFLSKSVHFFIEIYGDKAYKLSDEEETWFKQGLVVYTPIKKQKGQERLDSADKLYSTAVSRIRQPIEALFAWIEQKSGIESAGKVRSYAGLMVLWKTRRCFLLLGAFENQLLIHILMLQYFNDSV